MLCLLVCPLRAEAVFSQPPSSHHRPDPSKLLATCFWNETGGWMEKSGKEEEGTEEEERKERWSKALGRELRGSKNVFPNPSNPGPIKWLCLPV